MNKSKKNKILLVNLSLADISTTVFYVMPIGLLSVAAYLVQCGLPVDVIDFNVLKRKNGNCPDNVLLEIFKDSLAEIRPALVGFSVMVAGQFKLANAAADIVKRFSRDMITVVGGAHVSQFPREILQNCAGIDFVAIGEGEEQALALALMAQGGSEARSYPGGLGYRANDRIITTPKLSFVENLDHLPVPAYDLLGFSDYFHDTSTWHNPYQIDFGVRVPIVTSRGCPNLCTFCSVSKAMGDRYRPMSAGKVVDMLQKLIEHHDARTFVVYDANFSQETRRVIDICEEIRKRNLKVTLDLPTGLPLNAATKDLIDALVSVGLIRTCVSVESGDLFIRNDVMKKRILEEEVYDAIAEIRKYPHVFLMTDFVIGMPEETVASLDASVRLIENLDTDDIDLSIATPYPGTELFAQCEKDGLFSSTIDKDQLYRSTQFSHSNRKQFVIKPYQLDHDTLCQYRDEILSLRKKKIRAYHARMKRLFQVDSKYRRELV